MDVGPKEATQFEFRRSVEVTGAQRHEANYLRRAGPLHYTSPEHVVLFTVARFSSLLGSR